jgi:hypothetical protein
MKETQLKELQGASRLTLGFFNRLIRRIECTKPLAGSGITITEQENGFQIASDGGISGAQRITLNVCSNGTPATITVFGIV